MVVPAYPGGCGTSSPPFAGGTGLLLIGRILKVLYRCLPTSAFLGIFRLPLQKKSCCVACALCCKRSPVDGRGRQFARKVGCNRRSKHLEVQQKSFLSSTSLFTFVEISEISCYLCSVTTRSGFSRQLIHRITVS